MLYLTFVVYGSLVPFDFRPQSLDAAIAAFRQIPFLNLGVGSRADWVANGVLYVPVGLLSARLFGARAGGLRALVGVIAALLVGAVLAVAIEFAQQFFPPRTVSLNDLLAEGLGTLIGALLAPLAAPQLGRLAAALRAGGPSLVQGLLAAYALAFLLLAWFPYDVLVSADEWAARLASDGWGWLLAGQSLDRGWRLLPLLAAEVTLAIPLGLLLAARAGRRGSGLGAAFVLGCGLGVVLELGQLAIASGIAQGASVLTRGLGLALGVAAWRWAQGHGIVALQRWATGPRIAVFALGYLLLLLAVNGWFAHPWRTAPEVLAQWAELRLMPLYYHYYTSEAVALFSLGSVVLMYLPVGAVGWLRRWSMRRTLAVAGLLAVGVEAGKLLLDGLRPDPTNVLIALAAGWLALRVAAMAERSAAADEGVATAGGASVAPGGAADGAEGSGQDLRRLWAWPALALAGVSALTFPVGAWLIAAVLLTAAVAVWWRPLWALAIVPAALVAFDLAPWTGRLYWDEFDLLMLVVLAIGWLRTPPAVQPLPRGAGAVAWLLAASLALSLGRGLVPWPGLDLNAFVGYHGAFNGLRIAKGALWAVAFLALWRRVPAPEPARQSAFTAGLCGALAVVVAVALWERVAFVGLLDFESVYRVTGPFSSMNTGGAHVEGFLVVAMAFLAHAVLSPGRVALRWGGAALLLAACYVLMVTYSRNGYAAWALAFLAALVFALRVAAGGRWRRWALAAGLGALMVAASAPVLLGTFAQQRLASVAQDKATRLAHWDDALRMREDGWATTLFGMGLGSFPAAHHWRSAEPVRAASFGLARSEAGPYLQLGTGAAVYVEQWVDVEPGRAYRLDLRVRAVGPARLGVALCEKWMLSSAACSTQSLELAAGEGWTTATLELPTRDWPRRSVLEHLPVKLSLYHAGGSGAIAVDDLHLAGEAGRPLLANGDFSAGMDRWYFSADVHGPWHIDSLPVTVLFELGWVGVVAWTAALGLTLAVSLRRAWRGDALAVAPLAALLGLLVSGSVNTLIDGPRFLALVLVMVGLCVGLVRQTRRADQARSVAGVSSGRA